MTAVRIPLSNPTTGPRERALVNEVLASGWVAPAGPMLERFEQELAATTGRRYAVALSSGTAALQLQLHAAGVGEGHTVICPTLTFVATLNAITHAGATPMLVDCDESGLLDVALVEQALRRDAERRIAAVVPVDLYGRLADHRALEELTSQHGAELLVDAAESLGAQHNGLRGGGSGRAAAVSFNGNKIVTAAGGGAVVTDDERLAHRIRYLSTQAKARSDLYFHTEPGFNFRMSSLQAAVGLAQLQRLDEFLAARSAHRERYRQLCAENTGVSILGGDAPGDNCWLTVLTFEGVGSEAIDALRDHLAAEGIETRRVFTPLHLMPLTCASRQCPRVLSGRAVELFDTSLAVPSSPISPPEAIDEVAERIGQWWRTEATRYRDRRPGRHRRSVTTTSGGHE